MELDVNDLNYREMNDWLRQCERNGVRHVTLRNVQGQRYIGTGLSNGMHIDIEGTPGNDLGAFMDGCSINVYGNAQDAVGNTMNAGRIVVHGRAGDVVGYSARGGEIHIRGDVGYRVGIHMKALTEKSPLVIVGGMARDFLGEYMAGGTLIILGLESRMDSLTGNYLGTGMHGGSIYLRGQVEPYKLGREVSIRPMTEDDWAHLRRCLTPFCKGFDFDLEQVLDWEFTKLLPISNRPYGRLYVGSVGVS
ncbi:MAG: hypothetical protein V3S14_12430 [Anaerolineae bacterium]